MPHSHVKFVLFPKLAVRTSLKYCFKFTQAMLLQKFINQFLMALHYFSLEIVSDILHLLMNTVEEGLFNYACICRAFVVYTDTKQITCFCLDNV